MSGKSIKAIHIQQSDGPFISVECTDIVREIPNKRIVYLGRLNNDVVYIKLFIDPSSRQRHKERELSGLQRLANNNIDAPKVCCSGVTEQGDSVIVTLAIPNGVTLKVAWHKRVDERERQALIQRLLSLIATHHNAGLRHNDPHLNNFFVTANTIYTLDGADIVEASVPLDESSSLQNLALVLAQFQPDNDRRALSLLPGYCEIRDWTVSPELRQLLLETILEKREWRKKKYIKKIFRTCTQIVSLSTNTSLQLLERAFDSNDIRSLLTSPDSYRVGEPGKGATLKKGNTSTVMQLEIGNDYYVVKRYNLKGPLHRLKRMFNRSRAERSWENAHLLGFYGISTARPVAIRVNKFGPFRGRAWFVAEYLPGRTLSEFILDNKGSAAQLEELAEHVAKIMVGMEQQLITHGDLKATNFLVSQGEVYLIDLDSMRQYRDASLFKSPHQKDLDRFKLNWSSMPEIAELFLSTLNRQRDLTKKTNIKEFLIS